MRVSCSACPIKLSNGGVGLDKGFFMSYLCSRSKDKGVFAVCIFLVRGFAL